ncbi:MAG: pyrroline-5-carboxylate reductase [Lentihominibacter sp.]|nr:pyrroline-5-carboxylate reductase [Lentihominibacter sp.]
MKTIGFIGMGNMAQAIASGMINGGKVKSSNIYAYAPNQDKLADNSSKIGFTACGSLNELAGKSDVLIAACKPYQIEQVMAELGDAARNKPLISIAAGWNLDKYLALLGEQAIVQCIMPNTPAMVGEGVLMFETENTWDADDRAWLMDTMSCLGTVVEIPSALQPAGMAIAGCGPAFIDLVIEALGDAGVKYGLSRELSYKLASQMILGSAKLQLETGTHPGVLKDNVCSPGGTTICGVDALEHGGVRKIFIDAVDAVIEKANN